MNELSTFQIFSLSKFIEVKILSQRVQNIFVSLDIYCQNCTYYIFKVAWNNGGGSQNTWTPCPYLVLAS